MIEASFQDTATFMNPVVVTRFAPGRSIVLQNLSLIESAGEECRVSAVAENVGGLPVGIERHFGMPSALTARALSAISPTLNVWG